MGMQKKEVLAHKGMQNSSFVSKYTNKWMIVVSYNSENYNCRALHFLVLPLSLEDMFLLDDALHGSIEFMQICFAEPHQRSSTHLKDSIPLVHSAHCKEATQAKPFARYPPEFAVFSKFCNRNSQCK